MKLTSASPNALRAGTSALRSSFTRRAELLASLLDDEVGGEDGHGVGNYTHRIDKNGHLSVASIID